MVKLSPVRQLMRSVVVGLTLAAILPTIAAAKMPYFSVDVAPAQPRPGESIVITVRTWEDAAHTIPSVFNMAFDDLIVIRSASQSSPDIPIVFDMRGSGWYESTVTLPAGDWAVVAFPDRSGWATQEMPIGYTDRIPVKVGEPGTDAAPMLISAAVTLAVLALMIGLRVRLGRRPINRLRPATPYG